VGAGGYGVSKTTAVILKIYNLVGQEVATLVVEVKEPGSHAVTWNAGPRASDVYFYRMIVGSFIETKKLVLMK
jgi:hypothetical protein